MINQDYKLKYKDIRRKNTLKKALMLQNIFRELFLHKTEKEILHMLCQCGHYHYGQKSKPLSEESKVMYEYLVTHNYNPYTVYKWFLIFLTNEIVNNYAESGMLSQERMKKAVTTRKKNKELSKMWIFMEEARKSAVEVLTYV